MTAIQWYQAGNKIYESGLDRGVLYVHGMDGVPWTGLTSVAEDSNNVVNPIHFDATKINDLVVLGNFSGVLRAFTYPDEFLECEGVLEDQEGIYLSEQPVKRFNLSYRTKIGESDNDFSEGYKIHILYNLTAVPSQKVRKTLGLSAEINEFEWNLTSIPEEIAGYRPTSHLIVDSRNIDPWLLIDLEEVLYGNDTREPTLPSLRALTTFIRKWDRMIIVDHGDGTWSAIAKDPDQITMISGSEFSIEADNVTYLDADTYEISSSDKNEEDV